MNHLAPNYRKQKTELRSDLVLRHAIQRELDSFYGNFAAGLVSTNAHVNADHFGLH